MTTTKALKDRAVLRLSGEDVENFLQGLVTNDVSQTGPIWAGLLTPQGKVLFDFFVDQEWELIEGAKTAPYRHKTGAFLIDCEAIAAHDLIKRLSMYRLRKKISIEADPTYYVGWSFNRWSSYPDSRLEALGHRWIGRIPNLDKEQIHPNFKAPSYDELEDGSSQFRAHRLSLGVCEGRAELGYGENLWLECNAAELNGVSFSKGCYVGQENTARMNWRQKINRRLFVLPDGTVERRPVDSPGDALIPAWLKNADISEI